MIYVLCMTPPPSGSVFELYRKIVSFRVIKQLAGKHGVQLRARKYTLVLLFWLMIWQRLATPGTLAQAVSTVRQGQWGPLVGRRRGKKKSRPPQDVSSYTGGYCRARQRVPTEMMKQITGYLTAELQKQLGGTELRRAVYVIDGSSLQLQPEQELVEHYPPARNQHGCSHWPVLRLVVLHDAHTGLALSPAWAPMSGTGALSEQALAEQLMGQVPPEAVLLGDRNFGIFATAFAATQRQRAVILRLTGVRAQCLGGHCLQAGTDREVVWCPSRWDRKHHPELPAEASVRGRLLVCGAPGWRQLVCLFTTLDCPAQEILDLYRLRWNIETDLRSLKQTVRLHRLTSKSQPMIEKELWAAIAAYNLVRTVIARAAHQASLDPRRLSFAQVLYLVNAFLPDLVSGSPQKAKREMKRLIELAATCKLPQRRRSRSYPRAVWRPGYRYPAKRQNMVNQSK